MLVTLSQAEIRDAPYKPSVPHLAKCRVLSGHCRHHRNMSPSKSGKAKDRPPPTRVWDPFGNCFVLDFVPVSTQMNAVFPRNWNLRLNSICSHTGRGAVT